MIVPLAPQKGPWFRMTTPEPRDPETGKPPIVRQGQLVTLLSIHWLSIHQPCSFLDQNSEVVSIIQR
jgi:hypothetical protein